MVAIAGIALSLSLLTFIAGRWSSSMTESKADASTIATLQADMKSIREMMSQRTPLLEQTSLQSAANAASLASLREETNRLIISQEKTNEKLERLADILISSRANPRPRP